MDNSELKSISVKLKKNFQDNSIILKSLLGKGAFGQCFAVEWEDKTTKEFIKKALKFVPGDIFKSKKDLFNREISIHKRMHSKFIVQLHSVNIDPITADLHMIMDLCINGSLADYIGKYGPLSPKPVHINRICSGMCRGLIYLHDEQNIVHRDIKPANILLNERMHPKISDFGLAASLEQCQQTKQKICGTPHYLAPEIFQQYGHSFQSDIWAFGITLYFLATGFTPFETHSKFHSSGQNKPLSLQQTISQVYQNVMRGKYRFPAHIPLSCKQYVKKILRKDPKKRPNLRELLDSKFLPSKSVYPETPDDESCNPLLPFEMSIESVVFISDQPVIDGINNLSQRLHCIPQKPDDFVWVSRWGMKDLYQLFYTLNNGTLGGNINSIKGITITIDNKETHFQQEDVTFHSSLVQRFDELTPSNIIYYGDILVTMLRPFRIPKTVLIKYLSALESQVIRRPVERNESIFVYKWFFYCESIIFLLSNGCWQIGFHDHTKLFVTDKMAVLSTGDDDVYEVVSIEDWCLENTEYLDIIRTLIYSIL